MSSIPEHWNISGKIFEVGGSTPFTQGNPDRPAPNATIKVYDYQQRIRGKTKAATDKTDYQYINKLEPKQEVSLSYLNYKKLRFLNQKLR
jgi:hypothetical protein